MLNATPPASRREFPFGSSTRRKSSNRLGQTQTDFTASQEKAHNVRIMLYAGTHSRGVATGPVTASRTSAPRSGILPMARHHGPYSTGYVAFFPAFERGKVPAARRSCARAWCWCDRDRLGTYSFRRGATQAAWSFARLRRAGQWHASASRLYRDLGRQQAQSMASILVEASEDDSSKTKPLEGISFRLEHHHSTIPRGILGPQKTSDCG